MSARTEIADAILSAAAELFRVQGYASTSMLEIAEKVGLSRPALYYHFKNKEELLGSLVEDVTVRTQREAARIAETAVGSDHRDTLRTMMRAQALWILSHPQHFAVVQRDEASLPDHLRAIQDRAKRDLLDRFRQVIAAGVEAGQFRRIEPTIAALCMFGMCNSTIQWFRPGSRLSEEQVAEIIADLATAMVARTAAPADGSDPHAWLAMLRDDLDHLTRTIPSQAPRSRD
ncbi:MAG: TetR/AcrR family transcriptional regulator [Gemmatimonadaceae bacterium]|nr:TetR/AcrR family transcriptional regulator [Acetobacteraceae bacterium]